jgi:hypothetical protein
LSGLGILESLVLLPFRSVEIAFWSLGARMVDPPPVVEFEDGGEVETGYVAGQVYAPAAVALDHLRRDTSPCAAVGKHYQQPRRKAPRVGGK